MSKFTKRFLQISAFFLGFLFLVVISAVVTMKIVTWGKTVVVPDVSGRAMTAAIVELRKNGLDVKVERQEHHPTVPEGSIISQNPKPGSSVKKGRDVKVVVSLGSEEVEVPDLSGEVFRRAQVQLKQAGLVLGEVSKVSSKAQREEIIMQQPAAGATLQKGADVDLLVSDGPAPVRSVMPDITMKTTTEAEEALKAVGAKLDATGKGAIIASQEPRPGFPVAFGAAVKVTLAPRPASPVNKPPSVPASQPQPAPKTPTGTQAPANKTPAAPPAHPPTAPQAPVTERKKV